MPRYKSHITWFNDERFLGSKVTFPDCSTATWKLERKLIEHGNLTEEHEAQIPGWASEARAIFVCSSVKGSSRMEAILRIRMQYGALIDFIAYSNTNTGYLTHVQIANRCLKEQNRPLRY